MKPEIKYAQFENKTIRKGNKKRKKERKVNEEHNKRTNRNIHRLLTTKINAYIINNKFE